MGKRVPFFFFSFNLYHDYGEEDKNEKEEVLFGPQGVACSHRSR